MRLIGSLALEQQARTFAAWLTAEGIDAQVEPGEGPAAGQFEIWIKSEDDLVQARSGLEQFLQNPGDPRFQDGERRAAQLQLQQARKQQQLKRNLQSARTAVRSGAGAPLTKLLIGLSAIVALLTDFGVNFERMVVQPTYQALAFTAVSGPEAEAMVDLYGLRSDNLAVRTASLRRGELWRLVTPAFIHFGTVHLVFNMAWLWMLGRVIEQRYGTAWLGLLVLFCAAASNMAQGMVPERLEGSAPIWLGGTLVSAFGGMSGVGYGLFGFAWIKSQFDPESRLQLAPSTIVIMVAWLLLCMTPAISFLMPGDRVANWAHGVGLAAGMLAAWAGTQLAWRTGRRGRSAG